MIFNEELFPLLAMSQQLKLGSSSGASHFQHFVTAITQMALHLLWNHMTSTKYLPWFLHQITNPQHLLVSCQLHQARPLLPHSLYHIAQHHNTNLPLSTLMQLPEPISSQSHMMMSSVATNISIPQQLWQSARNHRLPIFLTLHFDFSMQQRWRASGSRHSHTLPNYLIPTRLNTHQSAAQLRDLTIRLVKLIFYP